MNIFTKTLLFARADHPKGYGHAGGTAHGYVVIGVECENREQVEQVKSYFREYPFYGRKDARTYGEGLLDDWFGGRFDYIGFIGGTGEAEYGQRFQCFGDNRFFGIYKAEELLVGVSGVLKYIYGKAK